MIDKFTSFYKQFPMVKIFQYGGKYFAFDGKSNLLIETCIEELENILKFSYTNDLTQKNLGKYYNLFRSGAFLPHGLKQIAPLKHDIKEGIDFNFSNVVPRKFVLEVTQDCTLRCKYCYFSDPGSNRIHTRNKMSKETAKAAIDFYFKTYTTSIKDLSQEKKDKIKILAVPSLSWWGGEPLLNFELMKWTKAYFETLPWERHGICRQDLVYSIVTNFTVFNDEIMEFLVNNNVYTFISLDGNKQQNNTNRVFPNLEGSYDIVKNNIDSFINKYPDYCKKHIFIQSVKADNVDYEAARTFLNDTFKEKVVKCMAYQQSHWGKTNVKKINVSSDEELIKYYEQFYNSLKDLSIDEFERFMDKNNDYFLFFKELFSLEKEISFDNPSGSNYFTRNCSCPIGIDNIFVDTGGLLHMCNKTDYSSPIGNVRDGVDMDKLFKIYSDYYVEMERGCCNCWLFGFCKVCPATAMLNGVFKLKDSEACSFSQQEFYSKLLGYIILNHYPTVYDNALTYFKNKSEERSFLTVEGAVYKSEY